MMGEGDFGGVSMAYWPIVLVLLLLPGIGGLVLPVLLAFLLVQDLVGFGIGLAEILVLLFFAPLAIVYGWFKAKRVRRAMANGASLRRALPRLLFLPGLLALGFAVALSERALEEGAQLEAIMALRGLVVADPLPDGIYTGSPAIDLPLRLLAFIGNAGLLLFFLSVPYVLGSAIAALLLILERFDAPLTLLEDDDGADRSPPSRETPLTDRLPSTAPLTIAIDGPAAAGKGTLARRLAAHYGLPYLDTGLLYRAVGRKAAEEGVDLDDPQAAGEVARRLPPSALDDGSLRGREAGELASRVAVHGPVRAALVEFQRDYARRPEGAILDGRDIGTVICPQAPVKIFVTASPEIRARRRTDELAAKGRAPDYERILEEVRERDRRDAGRVEAPLKPAADALLLDTSEMDIEAAFRAARDLVDRTLAARDEA